MSEVATSTSFLDVLMQMGGSATLVAFLAAGVMLAGLSGLRYARRKSERAAISVPDMPAVMPDALLDTLETTSFNKKAPLSPEEQRLMRCLGAWERRQTKGYSVLAGVQLGSLIAPDSSEKTAALEALARVRVDFVVIDQTGQPVLAIDLPGRAVESEDSARDAALRQIACDKARLRLIAPEAGTSAGAVAAKVDTVLETGLIKPAPETPHAVAQVA